MIVIDLSTRRWPTGADEDRRVPPVTRSAWALTSTDASERGRDRTKTGVLITRRAQVQILPPPPIAPGQRPFPLRRGGPRPLPAVNALSTRDGVGARAHSSVVVVVRESWSVLVLLVQAEMAADERLREHAAASCCLDHWVRNPMVVVGARSRVTPRSDQVTGVVRASVLSAAGCRLWE